MVPLGEAVCATTTLETGGMKRIRRRSSLLSTHSLSGITRQRAIRIAHGRDRAAPRSVKRRGEAACRKRVTGDSVENPSAVS